MSWSLSKRNVSLRVTKFAPETDKPIAGLTDEAREAHRTKREAECAKVEPAMELAPIESEPEDYREYGDWKDDYADMVGISRTKEL